MTQQYSTFIDQGSCQLIDHIGVISVQGIDAKTFLQGQLTCDMNAITSTQSGFGAHCTPKGRVISSFRVWLIAENHYLLTIVRNNIENAMAKLNKYAIFSKVNISDASQQWMLLGLLEHTNDISTINTESYLTQLPDESRYELLTMRIPLNSRSSFNWSLFNIKAGIVDITLETSELLTPHDINYPAIGAVSFNKGCYTGQEIVARMQHRGTLKTHLYCVKLNARSTFTPGTAIYNSAASSNIRGYILDSQIDSSGQLFASVSIKDNMLNEDSWFIDGETVSYCLDSQES